MKSASRAFRISTVFWLALMALPLVSAAQPAIEWQRCFGSSSDDYFFSIYFVTARACVLAETRAVQIVR